MGKRAQVNAAIYSRVSTSSQDHSLQVSELMTYCQKQGWDVVQYADTASGSNAPRPDFKRLMEDCRVRKVDVLVVWKLDRFGRSLQEVLEKVRLLDAFGVRFIALRDGIDTDKANPLGKLQLHMIGAFAEFEKAMIQERSRAGVAEARRQGKQFGRPRKIFDRKKASELHESGMSFRDIGIQLCVPWTTVRDAFKEAL
jgi:putative DNA-invertase from lambdoid prophage Rac